MSQNFTIEKSTLGQVMAGAIRQQAITWANVDSDLCGHRPHWINCNVFFHFIFNIWHISVSSNTPSGYSGNSVEHGDHSWDSCVVLYIFQSSPCNSLEDRQSLWVPNLEIASWTQGTRMITLSTVSLQWRHMSFTMSQTIDTITVTLYRVTITESMKSTSIGLISSPCEQQRNIKSAQFVNSFTKDQQCR